MSSASAWDVVPENQISEGKAEMFESVASFARDAFAARRPDVSAETCCARIGERLFMKLMKGANEEDWNLLANFERDDYTRIFDHGTKSVFEAVSLPWTWRFFLTRFNRKHILCDRSLPRADRARR